LGEVEPELALQPLPHDLQVEQAQEADPEPEAQRGRGLRLPDQRGIVELQPLERVAKVGVVVAVDRVEPGEDHRDRVAVAAERGRGRVRSRGHRVPDP
jgi:hypothetical protein